MLFGRIADLYGRRRLFLIGIALMAVASTIGGLATSPALLLTGRALQGVGTAIATPAALSLLTTAFPDEKQRARVLGINGALRAGGFTVGALVGGTLVGALSWRWAFLINVPVAALILISTPLLVKSSRARTHVTLDVPGAITVTLGLLSFTLGVTSRNLYSVMAGLVLLVAFWLIEQRAKMPLAAMITGLMFGVPGLAAVVAGVAAGRFVARFGARNVLRGLPESEQGLATGLASMSQQVGSTIGVPILGAVAATQTTLLAGIHVAVTVDVVVTMTAIALIWTGLRPRAHTPRPQFDEAFAPDALSA